LILDRFTESITMGSDAGKIDALEIRPFQTDDMSEVVGLWRSCNLTRLWNDPDKDITRKLRVNPEWFLVAALGEKIVASIMIGYEGHRGWINYLAVAIPFRRHGIGTRLMQEAETILRSVGCAKINLQIRVGSEEELTGFYMGLGFRRDEVVCYGKRLEADKS
jgi:Acetyltransferases